MVDHAYMAQSAFSSLIFLKTGFKNISRPNKWSQKDTI